MNKLDESSSKNSNLFWTFDISVDTCCLLLANLSRSHSNRLRQCFNTTQIQCERVHKWHLFEERVATRTIGFRWRWATCVAITKRLETVHIERNSVPFGGREWPICACHSNHAFAVHIWHDQQCQQTQSGPFDYKFVFPDERLRWSNKNWVSSA